MCWKQDWPGILWPGPRFARWELKFCFWQVSFHIFQSVWSSNGLKCVLFVHTGTCTHTEASLRTPAFTVCLLMCPQCVGPLGLHLHFYCNSFCRKENAAVPWQTSNQQSLSLNNSHHQKRSSFGTQELESLNDHFAWFPNASTTYLCLASFFYFALPCSLVSETMLEHAAWEWGGNMDEIKGGADRAEILGKRVQVCKVETV